MPSVCSRTTSFRAYRVWDRTTRWFHWINFLSVVSLIVVALIIINGKALGVSTSGKIGLKTLHVLIGYVFAANLLWRLIWAFIGNRHARWRGILPGGSGYGRAVQAYLSGFMSGTPVHYLGHNPLGRIAVLVLLALLAIQGVTGLVLAGTDIFYPPLGDWIAHWVAAPGVNPDTLAPYAKEMVDADAFKEMRAFRKPFKELHEGAFVGLSVMIPLHMLAVVITEIREGGGLVSAMFSGKKYFSHPPHDAEQADAAGSPPAAR